MTSGLGARVMGIFLYILHREESLRQGLGHDLQQNCLSKMFQQSQTIFFA